MKIFDIDGKCILFYNLRMDMEELFKRTNEIEIANKDKRVVHLSNDELALLILSYQNGNNTAEKLLFRGLEFYIYYSISKNAKHLISDSYTADMLTADCKALLMKELKNANAITANNLNDVILKEIDNIIGDIEKKKVRDNIFSKETLNSVLPKMPLDYQEILRDYYINGKTCKEIADSRGGTKDGINSKLARAREELFSLVDNGYKHLPDATTRGLRLSRSRQRLDMELSARLPMINLETEFYPYLSEKHRRVFDEYMLNYTGKTMKDLSEEMGFSTYVSTSIPLILKKMDMIIERKKEVKNLYNLIGGEKGLKDLYEFLDVTEKNEREKHVFKTILEKHLLSIQPESSALVAQELNLDINQIYAKDEVIMYAINKLNDRKEKIKSFARKNGGEKFLTTTFAKTLNPNQQLVLNKVLLDFRYKDYSTFDKDNGWGKNVTGAIVVAIDNKLEKYKKRKTEIDNIIQKCGGREVVKAEFYNNLSDFRKEIFSRITASYFPETYKNLASDFGVPARTAQWHADKVGELFNKYVEQKSANREDLDVGME